MRALRDFNIPKIVTDDLPVFMGLIGDLFPALDVPRKRDLDFEKVQALAQHKRQRHPSPGSIQRVKVHLALLGAAASSLGSCRGCDGCLWPPRALPPRSLSSPCWS